LLLIDSVLSEELYLDHRMARPSVRALFPLIDMLYKVDAGELERLRQDSAFRSAIARLLHWTLLAPYIDQPDLEQLIVDIHGPSEGSNEASPVQPWEATGPELQEQLQKAISRYLNSLSELWYRKHLGTASRQERAPVIVDGLPIAGKLTRLALDAFSLEVRDARSLQHPAIGWLYAIERRGGATEFSWAAQVEGFRETGGQIGAREPESELSGEMELCRWDGKLASTLYPEKQHIVPFTIARQIVDKGGTRATASPSNAIGNLTWLSHRQNSLEALSDRWTVMDRKRDLPNLQARGMLAPVESEEHGRSVLDVYEDLRGMILEGNWRKDQARVQRAFAAFCDGRSAWLIDQMKEWLGEPLSTEANLWLRS